MGQAAKPDGVIRFEGFELNPQTGELRKHGIRLNLQDQPYKLLVALLQHPGEMVSREQLRQSIWPEESFGDFDHAINRSIAKLRSVLGDSPDVPHLIETLPRRGYRFIGTIDVHPKETIGPRPPTASGAIGSVAAVGAETPFRFTPGYRSGRWLAVTGAALMVIGLAVGGLLWRSRKAHALTDKDAIVLADFTNTTGDAVFDGTLRQGLAVQLQQTPFLSLLSEEQIQQTLRLMKQSPGAKLTPEIAREICQRTGSTVVLDGSIAQVGMQYQLILKAVNCSSGELMTSTGIQASDKSHVLDALGNASTDIRRKLGESLATVQKYNTPLEQATTSSIEALQAYTLGWKLLKKGDSDASIPFFKQAIKLDPNFAMAHAMLAGRYSQGGDTDAAVGSMKKAFELRQSVSERERLELETGYHFLVTGDLGKSYQACEIVAQTYPKDCDAPHMMGVINDFTGQFDKASEKYREALRLCPENNQTSGNLAWDYIALDRLEDARVVLKEADAKNPDSPISQALYYMLAFLQNDRVELERQMASAAGKAGLEEAPLGFKANTQAYFGHLQKARSLTQLAVVYTEKSKEMAIAAGCEADAALREALFGNVIQARQLATSALRHSSSRDIQYVVALALAVTGATVPAEALAGELAKRYPENTIIQLLQLPTLQAQFALNRNEPLKAIESLQPAAPFEAGAGLYPAYFRGVAYLAAHKGSEAAVEFQKILDHRWLVLNAPIGALAHLQIARAYAMQGDMAKARAAYQDFFTLWKDADPDIPILKEAESEHAKLQ